LVGLAANEPRTGIAGHRLFTGLLGHDSDAFTDAVIGLAADFVSNEPLRRAPRRGWVLTSPPPGAEPVLSLLRRRLPRLVSDLGVGVDHDGDPTFELTDVAVTAHRDGDFLGPHHDNGWPGPSNGRLLSFVYWFHRLPQAFEGGQLSLSGWTRSDAGLLPDGPRIDLEPVHDTLVVFPSRTRHEVRPVRADPDNFASARFALVGFGRQAARS
jgi:hypothetical protein